MSFTPTPYKTLANRLMCKLSNAGFGSITEQEMDEIFYDYITPAVIKFSACKQDLSDRGNEAFNIELTETEIEILVNFMLIEWISTNYINVPSLLKQSLTSKDFNVFSSRNHLDGIINLREMYKRETRQMISIYSNSDTNLFATLKELQELRQAETEHETEPENDY